MPIPTIVALILAALTSGIRPFLGEVFNRRTSLRWLLIGLAIAFAARILITLLALLTGAITRIVVGEVVIPLVVITYLFALLEEIGWRGFALRQLATRHSPIAALLITGIPWSIIHIFFT